MSNDQLQSIMALVDEYFERLVKNYSEALRDEKRNELESAIRAIAAPGVAQGLVSAQELWRLRNAEKELTDIVLERGQQIQRLRERLAAAPPTAEQPTNKPTGESHA